MKEIMIDYWLMTSVDGLAVLTCYLVYKLLHLNQLGLIY